MRRPRTPPDAVVAAKADDYIRDRAIGPRSSDPDEIPFSFMGTRDPAKPFAAQLNMLKVAEKAKELVPRT